MLHDGPTYTPPPLYLTKGFEMLSVLKISLRSLLTAFGMSLQPTQEVPNDSAADLPQDRMSVVQWCLNSKDRYANQDRPAFRHYRVTEFARYKQRRGAKHEYIVVKVEHPRYPIRYLRIERDRPHVTVEGKPIFSESQQDMPLKTPGDDVSQGFWASWSESVPKEAPNPPFGQWRKALAFSAIVSKEHPANDVVTPCAPSFHDDLQLERKDIRNNPLPLVHLAILADTVHQKESLYNLFATQCYWYSDMIARVIARDHANSTDSEVLPEDATETCYEKISGKWMYIPVHRVKPRVVSAIQDDYHVRRDKFNAEVRIFS